MKDNELYTCSMKNELYHYGIKGQQWGVRRFQNEDGSYTNAGKNRYGIRSLFGFGKSDKPKYTDKELNELYLKDPNSVDYTRVDHKEKGDLSEAVSFVSDYLAGGTILGKADNIIRGSEFVAGLFNSTKYKIERSDNATDPSTGFKLKDREYSKEEDLKRVNPDFRDFNTNSKNNCMLCTVTTEMRRRGYDVTANKAGMGYFTQDLERWFPGVEVKEYKMGSDVNFKFTPDGRYGVDPDSLYNDFERQITTDNPEGARGNLMVEFSFGGGHSMFYEIQNGKIIVRDGQTGQTYTRDELRMIVQHSVNTQWARLDNLKFDPEAIKECCR